MSSEVMTTKPVNYDDVLALVIMQYGKKIGDNYQVLLTDEVVQDFQTGEGDLQMVLERDEQRLGVAITLAKKKTDE